MHTIRPLFSLFATACLLACTAAGTNAPGPGSGGRGGSVAGAAGTSGSAAGTIGSGGGGGLTGAAGVIAVGGGGGRTCGLQEFDVERKPAEILLLLDRSKSMIEDTTSDGVTLKWNAVLPAIKQILRDSDALVSWGLKVFPESESSTECVAGSVTPAVVVPVAAMNASTIIAALEDPQNLSTKPNGSGTPTGDAVTAAWNYLRGLTSTNPKYILLATDGSPSCVGTTKTGGDAARDYAYPLVMAAATATPPVYTFVLGVATNSDSEQTALNRLADAGGRPRPGLLQHFYLGNSTTELQAALAMITGQAATCTFPLNPPPPVLNDPTKLGMYIPPPGTPMACTGSDCPTGQACVNSTCMIKVPHDGNMSNGWSYTDLTDTEVKAYGAWCDMIKASGAATVKIVFGCRDLDPPG